MFNKTSEWANKDNFLTQNIKFQSDLQGNKTKSLVQEIVANYIANMPKEEPPKEVHNIE